MTSYGRVDVLVAATGPDGVDLNYGDIQPHAVEVVGLIAEGVILIASLSDLIVMKSAAARPKDLEALPELRRLAEQPFRPDPPPG